jgi:long-chain acyl-CoA synthetase
MIEYNNTHFDYYPCEVDWDSEIVSKPIHHLLEKTAQNYSENIGIEYLGKTYSWAEINENSCKIAKSLQDKGYGKGTHIGILMPNCPEFIFSYFAILRIGATVVHFNPLYTQWELENLIETSDTKVILTVDLKITANKITNIIQHKNTPLDSVYIFSFANSLPCLKKWAFKIVKSGEIASPEYDDTAIIPAQKLLDNDGQYEKVDIEPENDVALLQFTGGTTGLPKAAMLTHGNLYSNTIQCKKWFHSAKEGEERIAAVLPFFHVFAMTAVMNLGTSLAMTLHILPRFELKQTLKMLHKKKITFFPAVPAIYNAINHDAAIDKYDLSNINICVSGGAPLPEEVKKEFEAKTGCVLVEGYGLTESSPVACVNPITGENKSGSIGLPLPQTQIGLFGLEDRDQQVEIGQRGELCIKGPQVMKGYYKQEQETADSFTPDGYLRTGDVAVMDEQGYFFIVDRIKDLIISNGYNIYPRCVEEAIYLHPAVEECIVAGIPDEKRGEAVKAWIKLKEGKKISANDMKSFLQDKLSPLEMPRHIEFRDQPLPKTMIGKLSRKDILAEEANK